MSGSENVVLMKGAAVYIIEVAEQVMQKRRRDGSIIFYESRGSL